MALSTARLATSAASRAAAPTAAAETALGRVGGPPSRAAPRERAGHTNTPGVAATASEGEEGYRVGKRGRAQPAGRHARAAAWGGLGGDGLSEPKARAGEPVEPNDRGQQADGDHRDRRPVAPALEDGPAQVYAPCGAVGSGLPGSAEGWCLPAVVFDQLAVRPAARIPKLETRWTRSPSVCSNLLYVGQYGITSTSENDAFNSAAIWALSTPLRTTW